MPDFSSQSDADLSTCQMLVTAAHHAGVRAGDLPAVVDFLFRQSKLVRPKWDEAHYADGQTYGEHTIRMAVDSNYALGAATAAPEPAQGRTAALPAEPPSAPSVHEPVEVDSDVLD